MAETYQGWVYFHGRKVKLDDLIDQSAQAPAEPENPLKCELSLSLTIDLAPLKHPANMELKQALEHLLQKGVPCSVAGRSTGFELPDPAAAAGAAEATKS